MTVRLVPKTVAKVISPGTELPFLYVCEESIIRGSPVAKSETTGRILLAQASTMTRMPCFGFAIKSGYAGDTIKVISVGIITNVARDADFNYDDEIYLSTNKGKVTNIATEAVGTYVQRLGRALNTSDVIITIDETIIEIS